MKPITISEKMMFNTVQLMASNGAKGTGFFFDFKINGITFPTLITNKHVVNDNPNELVVFSLHVTSSTDIQASSGEVIQIPYQAHWVFHPKQDLCFTPINPLFQQIKQRLGKNIFYISISEDILPSSEQLNNLSALEELVMVGYPIGLVDTVHNYPIFRKGFTASHPAFDFNKENVGLVDMACFPGSSGSPIYILNEYSYVDKRGNINMGQSRIIFLGVLYSGPVYTSDGKIVVKDIPTTQTPLSETPIMTNLGYYIKSSVLLDFKKTITSMI